jgi:hypothetical protein
VLANHPRAGPLRRDKIGCLKQGVWLNDEVINLYISMLLVGGAGAGAGEGRVGGGVQAQQQGWLVLGLQLQIWLLNIHPHPMHMGSNLPREDGDSLVVEMPAVVLHQQSSLKLVSQLSSIYSGWCC